MSQFEQEKREHESAEWLFKSDRGLSAREQDELFDWIAADSRNALALSESRRNWKRLDGLASWMPEHSAKPNPDLLAPHAQSFGRRFTRIALGVAAGLAAALAISFIGLQRSSDSASVEAVEAFEPGDREILSDGSVLKLKGNVGYEVRYTPEERRVILHRGEAFFIVAKNPNRPFVVEIGGVDVSALGTAFNVRVGGDSFEVLVSEGLVKVDHGLPELRATQRRGTPYEAPILEANQRAVVSVNASLDSPEIATLTRGEIRRVLAWQHGLIDFSDMPLSEIAYELNHFNETQMVVDDPELASIRFSGSVRSDNMVGFVRILEQYYGARADWNGLSTVTLFKNVD